jgi:hypothetical protein
MWLSDNKNDAGKVNQKVVKSLSQTRDQFLGQCLEPVFHLDGHSRNLSQILQGTEDGHLGQKERYTNRRRDLAFKIRGLVT